MKTEIPNPQDETTQDLRQHLRMKSAEEKVTIWQAVGVCGWGLALLNALVNAPLAFAVTVATVIAVAATVGSIMWTGCRGNEEMGVGDTQGREAK